MSDDLYLEAHVTISPIVDPARRQTASTIAGLYKFKLAHLVMVKDQGPDKPSQRDTFMTSHGKHIDELAARTKVLVGALKENGFRRYKIESCVIDSRQHSDIWDVLDPDRPEQPLIACDGCRP